MQWSFHKVDHILVCDFSTFWRCFTKFIDPAEGTVSKSWLKNAEETLYVDEVVTVSSYLNCTTIMPQFEPLY